MSRFDTVLIANRGEIAARIIRGCRAQGYKTVAVYSDADAHALHVREADTAVRIGAGPVGESYLSIEKLLEAAKASGAGAIHPGYGFLSERHDFAQAVQDAGLVFIGPDPAAIKAMGNKSASKELMIAAKVPCVPGYQGDGQEDDFLAAEAVKVGLPVMVKAASGGGGRGMRLVHEAAELKAAIQSARSEATNAFGDGQLLIEKAVLNARHVEIQVFGDRHGTVVYLGERDCSVQRRNQKVIEEAPSPAVSDELRARMGEAAVAAAKAVNYVGAGTVEFMLAADGAFYFLEMNTRLQVEHPVTEMIYGVDLVSWQLMVANGDPLPLTQAEIDVRRHGHAIEVRLCAEDPAAGFLPQTGRVLRWHTPTGDGLRADHCVIEDGVISPFYDSLQGKLMAWGETRLQAIQKLIAMLGDTALLGVASNRDFLIELLSQPEFQGPGVTTSFIAEQYPAERIQAALAPDDAHQALAAALLVETDAQALRAANDLDDSLLGWHSANTSALTIKLARGEHTAVLEVECLGDREYRTDIITTADEQDMAARGVRLLSIDGSRVSYIAEGRRLQAHFARHGSQLWLATPVCTACYEDVTYAAEQGAEAGSDGRILAPIDGKVMSVSVVSGQVVAKGELLLVLEAMKMEFRLQAPVAGTVELVNVGEGAQVGLRQLMVQITPAAE
ncbi:geranyl-CoA carboxylase alpha subunit [Paraperlucidibaca baekdonensis]|uniref:Biotin carboxylase n=1 Tax=Paraperlucidibaca baekdonensis TaxID=748120 RepID=A0A3E0HAI1_9GAMM|nr:biotin carboxylase N-terminal domain-containing protein [Paraperlucidibaca baekdonensis]REH40242.1 geranyl-CoA carboxylase alpha subunit [Paraperlucidibaca baekdonensis]